MNKSLDELLPEKSESRLRIYAYSIDDNAHSGQLKVGQTVGVVKNRIGQQLRTANVQNYKIHIDELAEQGIGAYILEDFDEQ